MSAFDQLKDISNEFEQRLRQVSGELFIARIGKPFEEVVAKKLQDLTVLNSKLRFIQAKPIAASLQLNHQLQSDEILKDYEEVASQKVLERIIVKSLTQAHAVRALITAPDETLDPGLLGRKRQIIQSLNEYRQQESKLRELDAMYRERQNDLSAARTEWDGHLSRLREARERARGSENEDVENTGPLYKKLVSVVEKLELMRWLTRQLVTSRGRRDWLADTKKTMAALKLSRTPNTVQMFMEE